ncbi:GNAT family N-acetyltransferase [Peribacillus sp. SCS-155]|uniref:GNAT family N-acetyltransferase n=1 Tax=Peribacillus sedimenti TaxID=3115297 RepID=UPI003906AF4B
MNPSLLELPASVETQRLLLRMPLVGDGKVVNKAIRESIRELKPWLPFVQNTPEVEETEVNIREAHARFLRREDLRYLIFHRETQEFIGTCSLHNIDWDVPKCEAGYWIRTKYSGKGYMTEAIEQLTRIAVDDLHCRRIEIRIETENVKSRAIPERLGFALEAVLKNEDLSVDGEQLTDTVIYAKTV